jgi:hypothetical protein
MSDLTITHAGSTVTTTSDTGLNKGAVIKLTPSDLSATAYTEGDIIFAKNEIAKATRTKGGISVLRNVTAFVEGAIAADNLVLLFFDNSTDLGEPAGDPASDITADEFRAAGCIGVLSLDGGNTGFNVGNGKLYSSTSLSASTDSGAQPLLMQTASSQTSLWVAAYQPGGTLDLEDTDSISLTFAFEYLS